MAEAQGVQEIKDLQDSGFSGEEIAQWRQQTVNDLHEGGFSQTEIGEYFGEKNPDMSATKAFIQGNVDKHLSAGPKTVQEPTLETLPGQAPTPDQKPEMKNDGIAAPAKASEAHSFIEAIEAGYQMSVVGLLNREKLPDKVLPQDAPMFYRIASQVGMLYGDSPAMLAGMVGGGAGGAAIGTSIAPGPGTAVGTVMGAGAGGFAIPTGMRTALMQHYEKGDIKDFGDFWERSSAIFLESMKSAAIGAATGGMGQVAGKVIGPMAAPLVRNMTVAATEVATMTTVGKAIEGHVPTAADFVEGAVMVGGMHAIGAGASKATEISGKLRNVYAKTGVKPEQILEHSVQEPTVKQDLLSDNVEVPKAYEPLVERTAGEPGTIAGEKTTTTLESPAAEVTSVVGGTPNKLEVEPFKIDPPAKTEAKSSSPEAAYKYEPMDVSQPTEGKVFYHGTKSDLPKLSEADVYGHSSPSNLYGEGLYLTDNPAIAESYAATKGKGPTGKVLGATLNNLKLVDLEKPLPNEVRAIYNDMIEHFGGDKYAANMAGKDIFSGLKSAMSEAGISKSEAIEVYNELNEKLSDAGYDGLRHTGGGKFNKDMTDPHNVVILFEDHGVMPDGTTVGRRLKDKIKDLDLPPREEAKALAEVDQAAGTKPDGVKPPEAPAKSEYELAQEKVLSHIGKETPKDKEPLTFNQIYRDFVDAKDPLNVIVKMTDKTTPLEENPYVQARLFVDHSNKAKHWFEFSPMDFETNQPVKTVKPLTKIIEPFKTRQQLNEFEAYLISKRALEIEASGRKTGVDLDAAAIVVEGGKAKYEAAAKEMVAYNNQLSKYMFDAGFLTKEGYAAMVEQNQAYVPMYKIAENEGGGSSKVQARGSGTPFKKLKGSDAQIASPLESIAKNTSLYVKRAEQNRAALSFVEFAEKNELMGGEFIRKVNRSVEKIEITSEVNKFLKEAGVEPTAENVAIFKPEALKLGENDVPVFRDGKMEVYEMAPEVAQIYRKMDGSPAANWVVKLLRPFATLQRMTIAMTPDFVMRNGIRDAATAAVFSKYPHIPIYDSLAAMGDIIGKSEAYQGWLRSGGGNGSFLDVDVLINKNMYRLDKETGFMSKSLNVLKSPFEMIHVVSNLIENSTRVAAYKNALKGKDLNTITLGESMEAGMQSREITVDFARMGAKAQAINQITAYWNVGIQGMDRTARAFQENPAGTAARAAAYVTAPSILLWWANKDDPRWREIPRWQKDAFWIVFTKDQTYRIPKPLELGLLFGTLPERTLEKYFTDNPEAMKDFDKTVMGMFTQFGPIPTGVTPVMEHWANKSTFTGNPIISSKYEGVFPQYQFTENTSESAKMLANFISVMPGMKDKSASSPMIIEHYVRAWAGNTGMYIISAMDKLMEKSGITNPPPAPTATIADYPFIKAFTIRYPSSSVQSIVDFEERYRQQSMAVKSIKMLAEKGDFDGMQKEMGLAMKNGDLEKLDKINQGIGNMNRMIQMINRDPSMSPDEKRQSMDGLYYNMLQAAQMGRELQRSLNKDLGTE